MANERANRKMSAILSADVKGYSRLMSVDEEGTVKALNECRETIFRCVEDYRGRVVDSPGDNVLAEFVSTVEAVNCAVKIQEELKVRNADLPQSSRMEFRVGVNLGDVIEENDRIYGDGVNIAARLEGLAESGAICISGTAFDHVKGKLSLGYQFIGKQKVKNIPDPIRAYKVLMAPEDAGKIIGDDKPKKWRWVQVAAVLLVAIVGAFFISNIYFGPPPIESASVDKMAYPLPDKPSVVVLPFENMSGNPEEDYFSDGLTEQIITTLSRYPRLFVIARQSAYHYKGKSVEIKKVAEDLGVQYVLKGGVQKSGDNVRINAQLIDAISGSYIWSERYDKELKDIFALQDEITINVMNGMSAELTEGEQARRWTSKVTNLKALEKHYRAQGYFCQHTKENYEKARPLFEEAIALDPEFVWPYVYLGYSHISSVSRGWSEDPAKSVQLTHELAAKAIAIDDTHDGAHSLIAISYLVKDEYDKALSEAERAVALNPNASDAYMILASILGHLGRWEESIPYGEKSLRLSPFPGAMPFLVLGRAYFMTGQYKKSIATLKKAIKVSPNFISAHIFLAECYSSLGRDAEADAAAKEVLRINPKFTIESYAKRRGWKNEADIEREVAALQKAGLPYTPPLPLPDKPSIAVLAFDNMTGDSTLEYFSDGIAEEIITILSMVDELFVIARNSSFFYKNKPIKIQQLSKELGVRYILEGSVRKSGNKVRVTAQLIDAIKGQHLWAESYDRDFDNIIEVQDEISTNIVSSLQVRLTEGEQARIFHHKNVNPEVYKKYLQAQANFRDGTKESLIRYGQLAQEIVNIAPESEIGYRLMGWYHYRLAMLGMAPRENIKKAFKFGQKAISINESDGFSHGLLCYVYLLMKKYEKAIASGKRAVELQPNGATAVMYLGSTLGYTGNLDEAIAYLKKAIRLNPFPPFFYYYNLGRCYLFKEQFEDALTEFKKAEQRAPEWAIGHLFLAITYIYLDRIVEARAAADKALELSPNLSVSHILKISKLKNQAHNQIIIDAMRKAGFPEGA